MSLIDKALKANKTLCEEVRQEIGGASDSQNRSCNLHGSETFGPP